MVKKAMKIFQILSDIIYRRLDTEGKYILKLFFCKPAFITISLIFIQQVIIGASVIILVYASKNESGRGILILLSIYVTLMTFAYIPGILSIYTRTKWRNYKYAKHTNNYILNIGNNAFIVEDKATNQINNRVVKMSYDIITGSINYITSTLTAFLNSTISIIVFSFALDITYAAVVLISFILIMAYIKYIQDKLKVLSRKEKDGLVLYFDALDQGLVNIMHGSVSNAKSWLQNKLSSEENFSQLSLKHEECRQLSYLATSLISLVPISMFIIYIAFKNHNDPVIISVLLVSITRIYHVISSLSELVYNILSWGSVKGSISSILISPNEYTENSRIIDYSKIKTVPSHTREKVVNINLEGIGRVLIKGENGSGKTSLLAIMKEKYRDKAVYYNPRFTLAWEDVEDTQHMSQGQKTMMEIEKLKKTTADYILLDEWDAFLDDDNMEKADNILQELSNFKSIIEVRHRKP